LAASAGADEGVFVGFEVFLIRDAIWSACSPISQADTRLQCHPAPIRWFAGAAEGEDFIGFEVSPIVILSEAAQPDPTSGHAADRVFLQFKWILLGPRLAVASGAMANEDRLREVISGPLEPDYLRQREAAGWRVAAVEWVRGSGETPEPVAREEVPYGLRVGSDCIHLEENASEKQAMLLMLESCRKSACRRWRRS
jgi:hypothetical protein